MTLKNYDVVQFNENHYWCGCLGYVDSIDETESGRRYLINVQIPLQGSAYIYVYDSDDAIEYIGAMRLIPEPSESSSEDANSNDD